MDDKIIIENNKAQLKINPKVYDLEVVYSASYVFLDKAYIILDGNPDKEILVNIKPKEGYDIEELSNEFYNELINYSDYKKRAENTKQIRELLLQQSIVANDSSLVQVDDEDDEELDKLLEELESEDDDEWIDDPEGIAIPWEEKYGKKED